MNDIGKQIAASRDHAQIAALLPILEAELDRLTARKVAETLRKLREGLLTPADALAAWQELGAIKSIEQHFRSLAAYGAATLSKS